MFSILSDAKEHFEAFNLQGCFANIFAYLYAASLSGSKVEAMEELDASSENNGFIATRLTQMKRWFFSHAQFLNFFTILILASVSPNLYLNLSSIHPENHVRRINLMSLVLYADIMFLKLYIRASSSPYTKSQN